jgi:hypothetical protein
VYLSFLFAMAASAQNLVPNSGFDRDLNGWIPQQVTAVWSNQDAGGSPLSGSLFSTPLGGNAPGIRSGCFQAAPGAYAAQFKYYLPEAGVGGATMFLRWYSDGNCSELIDNTVSFTGGFHGPPFDTIDSRSLGVDLIAPAATRSGAVQLISFSKVYFDDVTVQRLGACTGDGCLQGGRFAVTVRFIAGNQAGFGREVKLTSDSAYFWFFDPSNVEMVVKVLDGCALNGRYWVFMGGLTDVRVEIDVTDVSTGASQTYVNEEGHAFQPVQDTSAFATCP